MKFPLSAAMKLSQTENLGQMIITDKPTQEFRNNVELRTSKHEFCEGKFYGRCSRVSGKFHYFMNKL